MCIRNLTGKISVDLLQLKLYEGLKSRSSGGRRKGEDKMIFDTHAHYDDEQFDQDREELLTSMPSLGVGTIVNVSATYESCARSVQLASQFPNVYAAVGIHPDEVGTLNDMKFDEMKKLFDNEKVVAVGEIGLDYYWDNESHEDQGKWFIRQLDLARQKNLPVIIHSREAAADTMYIMQNYAHDLKAVIHCYSYSVEMAEEYVKMGYYIGVGGVVTFKNAKKIKEVVKKVPLERILLETDCPYLAPVPFRGKRNQSSYIQYVVQEIAALKGVAEEEVIARTEQNAREFYNL